MTKAPAPHRPRLRPTITAEPGPDGSVVVHDTVGIGRSVAMSRLALQVAQHFDGTHTGPELVARIKREFPQTQVTVEAVEGLISAMDEAGLLDSPKLRARFDGPVRKPRCFGSGAGEAAELRAQVAELFTAPDGPGMPDVAEAPAGSSGKLRAVLAPHMDYGRGNVTYGHAFAELVRNTAARVFVIVATSHYSGDRFILSRQHFDTPLGLVETDTEYVDRIADHYGDGLFDDPLAHVPEHSIELEAVLLQFLLAGRRPFKIVPVLTGSIHDRVHSRSDPGGAADIARMVEALRAAEAACAEPVCYLISGDLAHIGPKFGDKRKAEQPWLEENRTKDEAILKTLEEADPSQFFGVIAEEKNSRRICGLAPTWLTLEVTRPKAGKVLHYQQFAHPQGKESVSFAAAAFYG